MQNALSSYLDKRMSPEHKKKTAISLGGLSFTPKESLQHPSEVSPPSIKDMGRYSAKKNRKDYLDIPSGITPSNYSREHPPHYPDDSFPLPKAKLPKRRNLWPNT